MTEIGGYFGWETCLGANEPYHKGPALKSGRAVIDWLLPMLQPKHAWLPRYTCSVLYDPFIRHNIPYSLYSIDEHWEPVGLPAPDDGELLLYINYNDVCRAVASRLAILWKQQLIIDNTQAFCWQPELPSWSFNSARKWIGVADGAYVYPPVNEDLPSMKSLPVNNHYITKHLELRRNGQTQKGYPFFQQNEILCAAPAARVSAFSEAILQEVNVKQMQAARRNNYELLQEVLAIYNRWPADLTPGVTPMFYPFWPRQTIPHECCWQQKLFIPRLWPELRNVTGLTSFEKNWSEQMLPLPIDHRYGKSQMLELIEILIRFFESTHL